MTKYYSKLDEPTSYCQRFHTNRVFSIASKKANPGSLIAVTGYFRKLSANRSDGPPISRWVGIPLPTFVLTSHMTSLYHDKSSKEVGT
jgi:hypothetical protein